MACATSASGVYNLGGGVRAQERRAHFTPARRGRRGTGWDPLGPGKGPRPAGAAGGGGSPHHRTLRRGAPRRTRSWPKGVFVANEAVSMVTSTRKEAEAKAASTVDEAVADEVVTKGVPTVHCGQGRDCGHVRDGRGRGCGLVYGGRGRGQGSVHGGRGHGYGHVPGARLGLHCLVCLAATGLGTNGSRTRGARRGPAPGAAPPAPRSLLLDRAL